MKALVVIGLACLICVTASRAQGEPLTPEQRQARDLFEELIEIDTTHSSTVAARAMAKRLLAAGFLKTDVQVLGPTPEKQNLVARLRGTGQGKPILFLGHLDVVAARRDDWTVDPFVLLEKDGYFYGRGTSDMKSAVAVGVDLMIRFRRAGISPKRDIILALTADEEGGAHNGVAWLLAHHRDLIDADVAINEGGGGVIRHGEYLANEVQAGEKLYQTYHLEVRDAGGHSSIPTKTNAIYRLAAALSRVGKFEFPVAISDLTRAYFTQMAPIEGGAVGRDLAAVLQPNPKPAVVERVSASPYYNALMRTTCVATELSGGHAENALPQTARATVNCRILPGVPPEAVRKTLEKVVADPKVTIKAIGTPTPSPASPLRPDVMAVFKQVTEEMWPGLPLVPSMSTGASDSLHLRNAGIDTYGISGLFADVDDIRDHGRDERIGVKQFYDCQEFLYRVVKRLAF